MAIVSKNQPIAEGIQMILGAINGDPEMVLKREQLDLERARNDALIRQNNADAALKEYDLTNQQGLVEALSGAYNPTTGNIEFKPENVAKMAAFAKNPEYYNMGLGEGRDQDKMNLASASGRPINPDSSYSLTGQNTIADRNAGYSQELKRMENNNALANVNLKSRNDLLGDNYKQQVLAAKLKGLPAPELPVFGEGLGSELNYDVPAADGQDLFNFTGYGGADPMAASQNAIAQRKQAFASGLPTPDMGLPPEGSALPWTAAPLPQAQGGIAAELMGPPAPAQTATAAPTGLAEVLDPNTIQTKLMTDGMRLIEIGQNTGDLEIMKQGLDLVKTGKTSEGMQLEVGPDGEVSFNQGGEGFGLTPSVESDVQKKVVALQNFKTTLDEGRRFALDETNFGATGLVKGTVQDVMQQSSAMSKYLRGAPVGKDIPTREGGNLKTAFDPNIGALQVFVNTIAYQYATAVAGNDRISDADFRQALGVIGDPGMLLANSANYTARLDQLEKMAATRLGLASNVLQNGIGATPVQEGLGTQLQTNTTQDGWSIEVEQ